MAKTGTEYCLVALETSVIVLTLQCFSQSDIWTRIATGLTLLSSYSVLSTLTRKDYHTMYVCERDCALLPITVLNDLPIGDLLSHIHNQCRILLLLCTEWVSAETRRDKKRLIPHNANMMHDGQSRQPSLWSFVKDPLRICVGDRLCFFNFLRLMHQRISPL